MSALSFDDLVPQKARDEIAAATSERAVQQEIIRKSARPRRANGYAYFVPEHWSYAGLVCAFCRCPVDDKMTGDHDHECEWKLWDDKFGTKYDEGAL